jgi:hypothetical protein
MADKPTNEEIATALEQIADLLEAQDANVYRVQAYRNGASTVRAATVSLAEMTREQGEKELRKLPDIGEGIARVIRNLVTTGRAPILERLKGESLRGYAFTQVPGLGEELAQRVAEELHITTLEQLEQAAHDGRLQLVEGFGDKRVNNIQVSLSGMLSTTAVRRTKQRTAGKTQSRQQPDVALLLDVDEEYRHKAEAGELQQIAPRRFNPDGEAWLPILHTEQENWDFTVLYSNTAQAHKLNKTADWVVIYYEQEDGQESQATVVTETRGSLEGKRVVRGREAECRQYYKEK